MVLLLIVAIDWWRWVQCAGIVEGWSWGCLAVWYLPAQGLREPLAQGQVQWGRLLLWLCVRVRVLRQRVQFLVRRDAGWPDVAQQDWSDNLRLQGVCLFQFLPQPEVRPAGASSQLREPTGFVFARRASHIALQILDGADLRLWRVVADDDLSPVALRLLVLVGDNVPARVDGFHAMDMSAHEIMNLLIPIPAGDRAVNLLVGGVEI